MSLENATAQFIDHLDGVAASATSSHISRLARLRLLDWVGCALAGYASDPQRVLNLIAFAADASGPSPVIGAGRSVSSTLAALINGMLAHAAEFDDGNRFGMVHPGAPVIAALLAMAIPQRLNDADVIRGVVVGYEASIRLARLVQPYAKDAGWHATGICGSVGSAMGLGSALGLNRTEMIAALSVACSGSSGLLKVLRDSSDLKPYNAGHAAQVGVSAVVLAKSGYRGPDDVLGGKHGYIHVMSGLELVSLGSLRGDEPLGIEQIYVKPYASCRHAHAPVEAALALRASTNFRSGDIAAIKVKTHRLAVHLHDHVVVDGSQSAKMSVPYCVGAAFATGQSGLAAFSAAMLEDPEVMRLTAMTEVVEDPDMSALVPNKRPAQVEIVLTSGERRKHQVDLPKGEPETPVNEGELRAKFLDLSGYAGIETDIAVSLMEAIVTGSEKTADWLVRL
jgi:2-methylcitrate dehydratase PrpD